MKIKKIKPIVIKLGNLKVDTYPRTFEYDDLKNRCNPGQVIIQTVSPHPTHFNDPAWQPMFAGKADGVDDEGWYIIAPVSQLPRIQLELGIKDSWELHAS